MNDLSALPERAVRLVRDDASPSSIRPRPSRSPTVATADRARLAAALEDAHRRVPASGGASPGKARGAYLHKIADQLESRRDEIAQDHHARERQAPRPEPGRGGDGGGPPPVVRRGSPPGLRPRRAEPGRRQAAPGRQDADGRRRRDQPVELPAGARGAQGGARAGGRVHGRAEAGVADAGLRGAARRVRARRRRAARRVPGRRRARRRRSATSCCRTRCAARSRSPARPRSAGC
ncbi:MAG: hypothetical protein M0C28_37375 [Candidatus Moduliflexus flocculans]|nr:hypothetical protein [Candidatus Moduliflexus flocculans]